MGTYLDAIELGHLKPYFATMGICGKIFSALNVQDLQFDGAIKPLQWKKINHCMPREEPAVGGDAAVG